MANDPKDNIERAQFICEGEVETRAKLSGDETFQYPQLSRFHNSDGLYIVSGSFKDGPKHGKYMCEIRYGRNDHWEFSQLSVSWPYVDARGNHLNPPLGHKKHLEVFIEDSNHK